MRKTQIFVLALTALPNDKHMAVTAFMAEAMRMYSIAETIVGNFVAMFLLAYEKENQAFIRIDRKRLTKDMNNADQDRINALRVLRDLLKTFAFRNNAEQKAQAEMVLDVIEKYGGAEIYRQPVDSRTGNITNIVEDLEEKLADAITALELTSYAQTLKDANQRFLKAQSDRDKADADFGKKAMADARAETDNLWRAIVEIVNNAIAYGTEEDVDALVPFARYMNVEIDKYRIQTGQGVGGNTGSTNNSQDSRLRNATFEFVGGNVQKFRIEIGAPLKALPNTPGFVWKPRVDEFMPARNIVFREVPIDEAEFVATFHFFDHREEEIRQLAGSVLHAPANTTGYLWFPTVPATMPAEDTSYYEMPIEQEGDGENNENQQPGEEQQPGEGGENQQPGGGTTNPPSGEQTGGGTNTPSGPNTDAWGDGDEGDGSDV